MEKDRQWAYNKIMKTDPNRIVEVDLGKTGTMIVSGWKFTPKSLDALKTGVFENAILSGTINFRDKKDEK